MAIGDLAQANGMPLVPDDGEEGKVRWGAQEINRTRDFVAQVDNKIPNSKANYQSTVGISYGTAAPSGGTDGDIYLRIV